MSLADRTRTGVTGEEAARLKRLATHAAVAAAALMIGLKIWAWVATGSVALLSSLVDSALDLVASALNLFAVRHALTPADEEHRFGHGKAEALAGLGQATFVGGSAAYLLLESLDRLILPRPVTETSLGLTVMIACTVITLALVLFQRHVIARTRSLAIGADQLHYTTDLATNLGVMLALFLAGGLGWTLADPMVGLAIAGTIGWGAFKIVSGAYHELMDREFDDADRDRIKAVVAAHKEVVSLHDLRTRRAGHHAFIQMHLELPPEMTLAKAHEVSDEVEDEIRRLFPDAEVLTHLDPAGLEDMKPLDRS